MMVKVEGNVRVVTQDMTLYGSKIDYNLATGVAQVKNARILTSEFSFIATNLTRLSAKEYLGEEAEFTTCKDCVESWSVYGDKIRLLVGEYVQIKHGLFKVKGIDVIYLPYIVIPILSKRETGVLIPRISQRTGEGIALEQPFFWAISDDKDLTLSPTFWAQRGYGGDLQYRQRFSYTDWLEINTRFVNDKIYWPKELNTSPSGREFFRYFGDVEFHSQITSNLNTHLKYSDLKDLDFIRDFPQYTDPMTNSSDYGLEGFFNYRFDHFSLAVEGTYLRNQIFDDPLGLDESYVQVLPRVSLSSMPMTLVQSSLINHLAVGLDSSWTRFRQLEENEYLRNIDRTSLRPYLIWQMMNWGPVNLQSQFTFDQQLYDLSPSSRQVFESSLYESRRIFAGKNAGILKTEMSFSMNKVFGLAYEEKIPVENLTKKDLKNLQKKKMKGISPLKKSSKEKKLVGQLEDFAAELSQNEIIQRRYSYRHGQNFKFIHHYISSENEFGNQSFIDQLQNQQGQLDYEDALRSQQFLFGANTTRVIIPPQNTLEFQWNNTLVKKSPKTFNYLQDERYLRDNFNYTKIGWLNISQGYLLDQRDLEDLRQRLTRLMIDAGFVGANFSLGLTEYYFHYDNQNIFQLNFNQKFEYLNFLINYTYNSFSSSNLNSLKIGGRVRPTDTLGLSLIKDVDLKSKRDIRTIYSLDLMPHNNCWIFNLNYRQSIVDSRFSFNVFFNFGDDNFDRYRNDFSILPRI